VKEQPGIEFEKVVASIQARLDPKAVVTHNERIVDRLGQERQFDVVIRGEFAGQSMLGVIECKDTAQKVGSPEVDAFITKSSDINANFKIIVSRRGFSKPAVQKCKHYGIQPLSLVQRDPVNKKFFVGTRWEADVCYWGPITVTLYALEDTGVPLKFNANELKIDKLRPLDWFTNYLFDLHSQDVITNPVEVHVQFEVPQSIEVEPGYFRECTGMSFQTTLITEKKQRLVGVAGDGFVDWSSGQARFPPHTQIEWEKVPMDFAQWDPWDPKLRPASGFLEIQMTAWQLQFERVEHVPPLEKL